MYERLLDFAVPFIAGGIISAIGYFFKHLSKRQKSLEDGVKSLLRLEIVRSYDKYTEKGYCPIYARESLTRAYNDYHTLGGNDVATSLYEKIIALPTESGQSEKKYYE